jgi:hypothetical protein
MAAGVPVGIGTLPPHTICLKSVRTKEEASGAFESEAVIVFGATLVQVCVCANRVIAKNVFGINPVRIA